MRIDKSKIIGSNLLLEQERSKPNFVYPIHQTKDRRYWFETDYCVVRPDLLFSKYFINLE